MNTDWTLSPSLLAKYQDRREYGGSFYELSMAYHGAALSVQDRRQVQHTLWQHSSLLGVVDDPKELMRGWQDVASDDFNQEYAHAYGLISLEDGKILACESFFNISEEITWFTLAISTGILELVFPVEYPLYPKTKNPWLASIDRTFATIGTAIYREHPFVLAVLGEEASAYDVEHHMQELAYATDLLVHEQVFQREGVVPFGVRSSEGLWWTGGERPMVQ